jgi:hypothetical protein
VFPDQVQRYAKGLYPVALLLILVPLVDLSLRTFPPQFGTLQWRFATVGLMFGNFGTILLGFGLLGLAASLAEHRKFLRGLGFAALAIAVVTLAMLALFALDAIQIRRLANANFKRAVLLSSMGALFTGTFAMTALAVLGRAAIVASRIGPRGPRAAMKARGPAGTRPAGPPPASPLVVAGAGQPASSGPT